MSKSKAEDGAENVCVVCCREVYIYAIGECDHPVCFECATRMRVLCRQNECPICRRELPKVIFVKNRKLYADVMNVVYPLWDRKYSFYFEDTFVQQAHYRLLEHCCHICDGEPAFATFHILKEHVRRTHDLFFCDICYKHLLIFTRERKCYNRQTLATHRRVGDADDKSHRGHPLCEFCDDRFLDDDELFRHLRREHFFCHFCDTDGLNHYYSDYEYLRKHFRAEHFLCEEGECLNEKFTTAFRSEIDLKAHRATMHNKGLTKAQSKQARTLELEFSIAPRGAGNADDMQSRTHYDTDESHGRRGRRRGGGGYGNSHRGGRDSHNYNSRYNDSEDVSELGSSTQNQLQLSPKINMNSSQDFPVLGLGHESSPSALGSATTSSTAPDTLARKLAKINRFTVGSGLGTDEFPALHPGQGSAPQATPAKLASKFKGSNSWGASGTATLSLTASSQVPVPSTGSRKTLTVKLNSQDDFPGLANTKKHRSAPKVSIQVDHNPKATTAQSNTPKGGDGSERQPIVTRMASSQNITFFNPPASVQTKPLAPPPSAPAPSPGEPPLPPEFVEGLPKTDSGWYVLKKGKTSKSKSPPDEAKPTDFSLEGDFPSLVGRKAAPKPKQEVAKAAVPVHNSWKVEVDVRKSPEKGDAQKATPKSKKKKKASLVNGGAAETTVPKGSAEASNKKNGTPADAAVVLPEKQNGRIGRASTDAPTKLSELKLEAVTPAAEERSPCVAKSRDLFNSDDFPNLVTKPVGAPAKRRSELIVAALASRTTRPVAVAAKVSNGTAEDQPTNGEIFSEVDFPDLKALRTAVPPPGFGKLEAPASRPPPGFVPAVQKKPPPGFDVALILAPEPPAAYTNSAGGSFTFPQPIPCHAYAQPDEFQMRNRELTERLSRILAAEPDKFALFKEISCGFRKGGIGAGQYYNQCVELMGEAAFAGVFPELLVLLPDIGKQQELLAVHNSARKAGGAAAALFAVCASCQQVLAGKDFRAHESSHRLDNNFPSLDNLVHTTHVSWLKRN